MDPNQQPVGRARGRGRGLYQHPVPFHAKDGHPGVSFEIFFDLFSIQWFPIKEN